MSKKIAWWPFLYFLSAVIGAIGFALISFYVFPKQYIVRVANADMLRKYYGARAFVEMNVCWPEKYMLRSK